MVPTAAKFGLAAAAVTAAVVGIGVAVDNYNQKALNSNLEEHFGNIKLSAQEVQDIASGILDQKYLANVEVALNEVKNADKLREDAQKALESNDVLEFKSRVGIKLTTEEQEDYTSNIETFVKSKIEELESRTFAAHIHVQTYLGGTEEGQILAQNIEKWATADYVELDGLSSQLSQKVSEALKDGIIDADEEMCIRDSVIAPLNANANAGNEELKGYQVAAYIAGIVAATPANQSVTHATLSRYSVLNEILTNTEMEVAEEKGCLVLSTASDGAVWLDNGVNTLVHPDANHDSGWKKIRRTKTRYELLNRANAAADALVGKVDNDTNGRATIMAAIQGICNAMEAEGKIQYGNVTESTTVTTDGDTCGFDIEVIDLDSAEHIYLNYYFQFSTIVAASGE